MVEPVVAVVGAGIAGLVAARELAAAGQATVVLDKSRGVGGRMATRRLGGAVCDHGAQFFTARGPDFDALVAEGVAAGRVTRWCDGFARAAMVADACAAAGDGHPRYRGTTGMTDLPKLLAAALADRGVTVRTGAQVTAVAVADGRVRLALQDATAVEVLGCVVTAPVPQALDLFAAGGLLAGGGPRLDAAARHALAGVAYDPCFALMLVLDRPSRVPPPGGIQFESGPISWIADNAAKGISAVPAVTIHAAGPWSRARFDDPPADVTRQLLEAAAPWIGGAAILEQSLHRWKFATPTTVLDAAFVPAMAVPPIVCCGDAFAGPKVEGAAASGRAAGRWLAATLAAG